MFAEIGARHRRQTTALTLGALAVAAPFLLSSGLNTAFADGVCGPGKLLVENKWACAPDTGTRRQTAPATNYSNQVAAGIALGGALFSIIEALASHSAMTDDVSTIDPVLRQHANLSVEYNRKGLALQQAGKFNEARLAFKKAAEEAINGGSSEDSIVNNRNANIADALHWLRQGYEAEKAGKVNKANTSYLTGLTIARNAGLKDLESQLIKANNKLTETSTQKNLTKSDTLCTTINGKLACR